LRQTFARHCHGPGIPAESANAIMEALNDKAQMASVQASAKKKSVRNGRLFSARDHPELAERIVAGELSANCRRHMSKGQQAMAHAMM
jgi:hypothetical protein